MGKTTTKTAARKKPVATSAASQKTEKQRIDDVMKKIRMGRPRLYCAEVLELSYQYIQSCIDSYDKKKKLIVKMPSHKGLALHLRIAESTLYAWADEQPDFSETLETIKHMQHETLANGSLGGKYNALIAKLMLHNHGYRDRVDATTDDQPINPFSDDQVKKIAQRITTRRKTTGGKGSK